MVLQIKESFKICQGVVVVVKIRVVPNPSECSSGSANKRVVQNLSVCSSSANKIVVRNLSERRCSSAIEMSFEV